jgi:amidohydrolase
MIRNEIWNQCEKEFNYIQKIRRHIHRNPELGFEVYNTAALVTKELTALGLEVKTGVGKTGVVADLSLPGAKRRVALRADMDALPIQEQTNCSYKSQIPGRAHMCGHDAHTAMLLGAARVIVSLKSQLKANVRFIFQPNEENIPGGAPAMIADGCLKGVDEIYGMHVWPLIPAKKYGVCRGAAMGRPDGFKIHLKGKGGHASVPHLAVDPITIGAQIVQSLQTIISRNTDPINSAVLSVTQFHAGTTHNVIPETAFIEGTFRSFQDEVCEDMKIRIKNILVGFEKAFDVAIDFEHEEGYPVLHNKDLGATYAETCINKLNQTKLSHTIEMAESDETTENNQNSLLYPVRQVLGGEDFAHYLKEIPGCYVFLGCSNTEKGITQICHDPHFDIDEVCLSYGTALHSMMALNFI